MKRIALIVAMEAEAEPLIRALNLKADPGFGDPRLPFRHYRGTHRDKLELLLSLNGKDSRLAVDNIGPEPATLNAYVTFRGFRPDLCINAGTAGGFRSRGGEIGDVYISDRPLKFHDRRIPIPGFEEYGLGSYPVLKLSRMAQALGLKEGAISTGSSLDHTPRCLELIERHEGMAKEMEAAAIGWVAWMLGVPLLALKAITDIVDGEHPTHEEFLRNLETASQRLQEKTLAVLDYVAENSSALDGSSRT
jgi:nucleoside phosphorylase